MSKESNILNKLMDYKNYSFKLNWSSGVVLVSAIVGCLYFFNENKSLKGKLDKLPILEETIKTLENAISGLKSSNETFNNIIKSFMDNPPSSLRKDIEELRRDIDKYHNNNTQLNNISIDTTFRGNRPPSF